MTASDRADAAAPRGASVWVIPVHISLSQIQSTLTLLRQRGRLSEPIDVLGLRERLDAQRPEAAVLQGGKISTTLMDAQRWLNEFQVPTIVIVQGLTEYYEATLLERGAQDVIGLPASERRLGSRLEALIRDKQPGIAPAPPTFSLGQLTVNPDTRSAIVGENHLALTRSEFDLLLVLTRRSGFVVTRRDLSLTLGPGHTGARALESHISRLRIKLRRSGAHDVIETVRGQGYRFAAPRQPDSHSQVGDSPNHRSHTRQP